MKDKIELFSQILNLKWQLNAMIIQEGLKAVDIINEAKAFEMQYQDDKKRNEFRYKQIIQEKK